MDWLKFGQKRKNIGKKSDPVYPLHVSERDTLALKKKPLSSKAQISVALYLSVKGEKKKERKKT